MQSNKKQPGEEPPEPPNTDPAGAGPEGGSTAEAGSLWRTTGEVMNLDKARMALNNPTAQYDKLLQHIGRCLGETYRELLAQPVPERFIELLKQLEAQDQAKNTDKTE